MGDARQRDFDGLVAVVTGGASGIGAAVADRLAAEGAAVAVFDLVRSERHAWFRVDVTDDVSVRAGIAAVAERFGGVDVLVNNAGIGAQGTVESATDAQWAHVLDVNVIGTARVTRAALPHLRRADHGSIVNICSVAATTGLPERAVYSASKGAILALTRAMATDHLADGIRVNCVTPGTADTPWVQRLLLDSADPESERIALEARQPHGRLVSADEVADAVAYLAGPRASSTTGVALAVDGGMQHLRTRSQ